MSLRAWLEDAAWFMVRPTYAAQPMAWGRAAALALLAVFALDMALDTLAHRMTAAWDKSAGFLPAPIKYETTRAEDLIEVRIVAPVLEELAFRAWLTGRIAALRFAVYGFAALALFTAALFVEARYAALISVGGAVLVFVGLIHWGRTRHRDTAVPAWFTRHFHWFVWGSALVFGLIHLGNYEPLTHPFGVLVVLPQTIGGLLLAYTRARLGLGAAMAHHAMYNAVFLAGDYGWW